MTKVSSKLKYTGDPTQDRKKAKERAMVSCTMRKLHWGSHYGEDNYPSPPNTPSPPASPPPPTPSMTDLWNTFRDPSSSNDDEDSPKQPKKKVHFAELPAGNKRTWLKKMTNKIEDIAYSVTATPLLHTDAGWDPRNATAPSQIVSSPKKRACIDDDYVQVPDGSPTKKRKVAHDVPWPEAYLFEDLDVFRDCEDMDVDVGDIQGH